MKINSLLIAAFIPFLVSCGGKTMEESVSESKEESNYLSFGNEITDENAITIEEFKTRFDSEGGLTDVKVESSVNAVCKKKGCWMNIDVGNNEEMRVTFKDYAFFVPTDCEGSKVIIQGNAYQDTTSVEMLRHFAEDEGLPEEEINAITEPEINIAFEATGVLVAKN